MKSHPHRLATAVALAVLALAAAGCKPGDKTAAIDTKPAQAKDAAANDAIPGLPTEKDQVSYMIGMDMSEPLKPMKDEIDLDMVSKGLKDSLSGGKVLLTAEQAQTIRQSFGEKLQAKQMAKMLADARNNAQAGDKFLADNAKKPGVVTTASGLQYQVLTQGKGPKPTEKDVVSANYTGTLLNGTKFDSTADHGGPATIPLQGVVPGWREGLELMPVGSKYRLWIPGKLGYGESVPPNAPFGPNETLVFDVELLGIVKNPPRPPMPQPSGQ